ncbi:MAG: hypothetical protein RL637_797 [Pseudomonadota bacterium]|jgi:NitT/TauT family transport system permease protein
MIMGKLSFTIQSVLSIIVLILIWQIAADYYRLPNLPSPIIVLKVIQQHLINGQLFYHLVITLRRLLISFSIAMLIGITLGILCGRYSRFNSWFEPWLLLMLNLPALVTIMLCYVWLGLNETAALLAVILNKIPNVIVTIREGSRNLNTELLEMAHCYRFNQQKILFEIILPQLQPFIIAATRSGLALIWKIILVVELLGCSNGMGYQLQLFFQLFDIASILAYSFAFILVMQFLELFLLQPWQHYTQRWKR